MTETLYRLAWALPLVLMLGIAAAFALRRLETLAVQRAAPQVLRLDQTLQVSDQTRVHLLTVHGKPMLLVEGASSNSVTPLPPADAAPSWRKSWLRERPAA